MRWRLFASFTVIILVTLVSVGYFTRQSAINEVNNFVRRGGLIGAETLVSALEQYFATHGNWEDTEELLSLYASSNEPGGNRFGQDDSHNGMGMDMGAGMGMQSNLLLVNPDGDVLVDPTDPNSSQQLSITELQNGIRLEVDGQTVGYLLSESTMSMPAANYENILGERLNLAAINAALVAGGLALLLASVLAYYSLRPVQQLTNAASQLAQGDMAQRVEIRGDDELAALGSTFNYMAESLEQADQKRRAMTADIAHELRNPLAVQRANLEALQDGLYPLTPENLSPVLEQNQLLTRLVDDLRTLAQADANKLTLDLKPANLATLLKQIAENHQSQAKQENIEIRINAAADCCSVKIDADRIEQILNNLIQNAIRHSPIGGWVEIMHHCEAETALVEVRDNGPGISPEALEHIFERFYRGDPARSRDQGGSG
ncbi:MAG: ATP-binding protein, partial [Chloroflexota bacterium]